VNLLISEIISVLIFAGVIFAVYAAEGYVLIGAVRDKLRGTSPKRYWSKGAIVIHLFAAIGVICLIWGFFIEPYRVEVRTVEIPTSKLKHSSVRVVQISDLHCTIRAGNEEKAVKIVNDLKPDVVVFTGDSANNPQGLKRFRDMMKRLEARLAKVGVRGNYDSQEFKGINIFDGTDFVELDANSIELDKDGEKVWITGVTCEKEGEIDNVLKQVPSDRFSIFLHHYPDLVEDLAGQQVDLYLAGHTHGGQIALPFYGAVITLTKFGKKYEAGMYKVGNTILYVNRGIGMDGGFSPRARFLARPEITVFEIYPPQADSSARTD
jgi:predicted MPP superfamily phosphohydrolase